MIKVLIDNSPLLTGHAHRGIGIYTKNLIEAIEKNKDQYPDISISTKGNPSDFDLVHYPYFDLFYNTLPLIKPTKTVVTIHDVTPLVLPEGYPAGLKGRFKLIIQKVSLKNISLIITDSQVSKKDIEKYLKVNPTKIRVVYLASANNFRKVIDKNKLRQIKEKYRLPDKFVLYTGGINFNKNIPNLVKACKVIGIPLVIIGKQAVETNIDRNHPENKDLVWLQDYAGSHQQEVILVGYVSTEELPSIYSQATVYCQPSRYEGFGIPVLEAMSCGCPVVATNRGSLPEICGDAVLTIDSTEYNMVAEALAKVLDDTQIQSDLRERGFKQVKLFSWDKTANEVINAYRQAIIGK